MGETCPMAGGAASKYISAFDPKTWNFVEGNHGETVVQKEELLLVTRYSDTEMAMLEQYRLHILSESVAPDDLLRRISPRIRALATNGEAGASAMLMDSLPKLEIVVCYGVGVDAIDLAYAARRGIRVTNTPDVLTDDVADMGIGLLIATSRQIPRGDAYIRAGLWGEADIPLGTRISGKKLGIVGLGRVGRAFARRAAVFGLEISYHDCFRFSDVDYTYFDSATELAQHVDFLVICAAADNANRAMIGREILDALGVHGILINIARGSIVDEPVLLDYLQEKRILGAGLDVFWNEPNIDSRFLQLDNVVLQPHRSSATIETRAAMMQLVCDNLRAFFSGKELPTEYKVR